MRLVAAKPVFCGSMVSGVCQAPKVSVLPDWNAAVARPAYAVVGALDAAAAAGAAAVAAANTPTAEVETPSTMARRRNWRRLSGLRPEAPCMGSLWGPTDRFLPDRLIDQYKPRERLA